MAQEKSADELRRELEEIARFPDMNPGPVLRLRDDGTVLRCNLAARKLFGKNLERRNWKTVCREMNDELWENIKAVDVVVPVESRIGERHFLFSHRTDRKTGLVFVFGTDISVNKVYEEQLEAQKAVIEEVARFPDMNPGPVLRMDLAGCITLCNAAATKLFGEDLKGQSWRTICREIDDARWNRLLASDEVFAVEAKREDRHFVFHHRCDRKGKFVFVFGTDITLQKNAEAQLLQSEKMATLGTLAAGVAHELNNPAAATRRAAQQLREVFARIGQAREKLYALDISAEEKEAMLALARRVKEGNPDKVRDPVEVADREADMESWLEELGLQEAWDAAPSLVSSGMTRDELAGQMKGMSPQAARSVLEWIALLVSIHELIGEIHEGSSRISEIVVALKNYSFLGQAPVQEVNLHEGLDNTLIILKNKLKKGIRVKREYSVDLPAITAYGSELNQVWTNILDNAADAMQDSGEITIRTSRQGDHAVIEIEDNGPGIPTEIQSRIFDPFFTTKEPGKGTGLGLSTSYGIVTEKHRGRMEVQSRPGFTRFTVRLPIEGIK